MCNNYFSNFGRPLIPDDLCKDSAPSILGSGEEDFLKVFNIYGHGGHLGQLTAAILAIFRSANLRRLYVIKLVQRLQRRSLLKMLTDGWMDGWTTDEK